MHSAKITPPKNGRNISFDVKSDRFIKIYTKTINKKQTGIIENIFTSISYDLIKCDSSTSL